MFRLEMFSSHKATMVELIDMYRSMKYLWDKSHPRYQDRVLRAMGYKKLLEKFKEIYKDATLSIFKRKLENMRTSYTRELKKVRASQKVESNPDKVYAPVLWYFDNFGFLENHVSVKSHALVNTCRAARAEPDTDTSAHFPYSDCNVDMDVKYNSDSDDQFSVEYLEEDDHDSSLSSPRIPSNRRKIKEQNGDHDDDLKSSFTMNSDCDIIGKAIGIQLRDVERHQSAIAQKLISDTLFHAKLGRLTEHSTICIDSVHQCKY